MAIPGEFRWPPVGRNQCPLTIVLAWKVGMGSLAWWPVQVFIGSIAAQSHLFFVIPSILLVLLAPIVGLLVGGRPERFRWLGGGVGIAFVCWLAPFAQNFGPHGNLTALLDSGSGQARMGLGFGLRALARAGSAYPIWVTREPVGVVARAHFVSNGSVFFGVSIVCLLLIVTILSWLSNRQGLAVLSVVSLVCCLSCAINFSIVPTKQLLILTDYLSISLWIIGILIWTVVIWWIAGFAFSRATLVAASLHSGRLPNQPMEVRDGVTTPDGPRASPIVRGVTGAAALVMITIPCGVGLWQLRSFQPLETTVEWTQADASMVSNVVKSIEGAAPRRSVVYLLRTSTNIGGFSSAVLIEGIAWKLEADGWEPALRGFLADYMSLPYQDGHVYSYVVVTTLGTKVVSVVTSSY